MTRCSSIGLVAVLVLAPAAASSLDREPEPGVAVGRKQTQDSLLFSREVQDLIEAARRNAGVAAGTAPADAMSRANHAQGAIHLSAILYQGPGDWQIWLNGRSFAQNGVAGPIEILRVRADSVRLQWHGATTEQSADITLRPNQTYIVSTGEIVEGPPERAWRVRRP